MESTDVKMRLRALMEEVESKRGVGDYDFSFKMQGYKIDAINKAIDSEKYRTAWSYVLGAWRFFKRIGVDVKEEALTHTNYAYYPYKNGNLYGIMHYCGWVCNGLARTFYESGAIKLEQYWHNGLRHGPFKTYYESGQVEEEKTYINGMETGKYRRYHENGKLNVIGCYKKSKYYGRQLIYSEDGRLKCVSHYSNGGMYSEWVSWGSDGRISEVGKRRNKSYYSTTPDKLSAGENPDMLDLLRFCTTKN